MSQVVCAFRWYTAFVAVLHGLVPGLVPCFVGRFVGHFVGHFCRICWCLVLWIAVWVALWVTVGPQFSSLHKFGPTSLPPLLGSLGVPYIRAHMATLLVTKWLRSVFSSISHGNSCRSGQRKCIAKKVAQNTVLRCASVMPLCATKRAGTTSAHLPMNTHRCVNPA